jgi:hypothetical protein
MVVQERCCTNIGPQYETFVTSNLGSYEACNVSCPIRLEKEAEVRINIVIITEFLKTELSLTDENVEISTYSGKSPFYPQTINGIRYELEDTNSGIVGEIFIIFSQDAQPYYIFRTQIAYEPDHKQMTEFIKELGLTMNMQGFRRESAYRQPVFYLRYDRFDTESFIDFLGIIAFIAEAYPLQMPRWKQYAQQPTVPMW